jgi:glycosyltransferase involved in cell wall biosynthesis/peptidoglycan/xylan/chitin deacetylase (PgdA/CDA1 family)
MKKVLIIEAQMKQYRRPFYEQLYPELARKGVQLRVAYGEPVEEEKRKLDNCELPVEFGIKVKGYWFARQKFLYQPLLREAAAADLVIVDQANRFVLNHFLLPMSLLGLKKVALWGLGENLQADRSEFSEWYKRRTLKWADWLFAYTKGTAEYLRGQGASSERITAVQNSIDTHEIQERVSRMDAPTRARLRASLGIDPADWVGVFVGMLHKVKAIPFLLQAARKVRAQIENFHLVVIGGGPEREEVIQDAVGDAWIHFVGPKFGEQKAELLGIADLCMIPGRVGLAVLDSFAAGLPLIATRLPIHGPEMEYLEEGRNGIITAHSPETYAGAIVRLVSRPEELRMLREGARRSAEKYSIQAMVGNFTEGIVRCLQHPRWRWKPSKSSTRRASFSVPTGPFPLGLKDGSAPANGNGAHLTGLPVNPMSSNGGCRSFLTTSWDDGHPLDFRIAELLAKYGLPGTFYVPHTAQRAVMCPQQVQELSSAFEIGAHTLDHVAIHGFADAEASRQLSGSREWIEDITGKKCVVFCFPKGKFKSSQLRLVREAGFRAARTVELLSTAAPRSVGGLRLIPTTIQAFPHLRSAYLKNAAKRLPSSHLMPLSAAMFQTDWVALANRLLLQTLECGGVFHLWGHSWEIEEQNQWAQLEQVLQTISRYRDRLSGVTNSELCDCKGSRSK